MSFKKTSDGRVFFQSSNENDVPDSGNITGAANESRSYDMDGNAAKAPSIPATVEKALEKNSSQLQILALLRSLNERLSTTQAERDQFRKDLEAYRAMVQDLNKKSERSDKALGLLEEKLNEQDKKGKTALENAEKQAAAAMAELEAARKKLAELEEKAGNTDKRLRDQILKNGAAETSLKQERETLEKQRAQEQEKLEKKLADLEALQSKIEDMQEIAAEKAREQVQAQMKNLAPTLSGKDIQEQIEQILEQSRRVQSQGFDKKIEDILERNRQLDRKLEKASQDRMRLVRKVERLEETVIQTHEALNAKALVLLTDQSVAAQSAMPQISASPDVKAETASIQRQAMLGQGAQEYHDIEADRKSVWAQSKKLQVLALSVLFVGGMLAGWAINRLPLEQFSMPQINVQGLSDAMFDVVPMPPTPNSSQNAGGAAENQDADLEAFKSQDAVDNAVEMEYDRPQGGLENLPPEDERAQMMDENPEELAAQLNALEPSAEAEDITIAAVNSAQHRAIEAVVNEPVSAGANSVATKPKDGAPESIKQQAAKPLQQTPEKVAKAAPKQVKEASNPDLIERIQPDENLPEAVKEIEAKAFAGGAEAQHDLAAIYTAGHAGVAQDYERAALWFREAAENGVANARYNLGVLYHQGIGVQQDIQQAINWYEQAAKLGHPEAQYNLGIAFVEGVGVNYDPEKAAGYFNQAARQGIMEAAYNLGLIYENGLLGLPEPDKALVWYKRAADQGSPEAKTALEQLARNLGRDVSEINALADSIDVEAASQTPSSNNSMIEYQRRLTSKVQQQLMDRGLYPGPADGINGQRTKDAIRSYQASYDLSVDGRVSKNLLNHMLIHGDQG